MRARIPIALCLFVALGCGGPAPPPAPPQQPAASQPASAAAPQSQPTSAPAPSPVATGPRESAVMATVNGRPIYMGALIRPLLETRGLQIARMLVAYELVEQEARRQSISVTEADLAAERQAAHSRLFGDDLKPDQRQRVLDQLLQQRGLTRELWDATVRQNALLAKMAEPRVVITEPMLRAEHARLYGEKVQISHIALPDLNQAEQIIKLLKQGQDFAELARKYSTSSVTAKQGGLLPPFSRHEADVPRAMRDAAFSLNEVGQISGIVQAANTFHVLKLHKRFPSGEVKFEAVRAEVASKLRRGLIERLQREMLSELWRKAQVEIVNPTLRKAAQKPRP